MYFDYIFISDLPFTYPTHNFGKFLFKIIIFTLPGYDSRFFSRFYDKRW